MQEFNIKFKIQNAKIKILLPIAYCVLPSFLNDLNDFNDLMTYNLRLMTK